MKRELVKKIKEEISEISRAIKKTRLTKIIHEEKSKIDKGYKSEDNIRRRTKSRMCNQGRRNVEPTQETIECTTNARDSRV